MEKLVVDENPRTEETKEQLKRTKNMHDIQQLKLRPSDVLNVHTVSGLLQLEDLSYYNII